MKFKIKCKSKYFNNFLRRKEIKFATLNVSCPHTIHAHSWKLTVHQKSLNKQLQVTPNKQRASAWYVSIDTPTKNIQSSNQKSQIVENSWKLTAHQNVWNIKIRIQATLNKRRASVCYISTDSPTKNNQSHIETENVFSIKIVLALRWPIRKETTNSDAML